MKLEGSACKRFALLLACRDSDYVKKVYGGYFNVFVRAFGDEGETWDLFRVVDGEFPEVEDLHRYDGFVVSGSPYDACGDDLWILRLCLLLQTLDKMRKRVLGICFGHQVLCRALGGRVGRASGGWDLGIRKVTMAQNSQHYSFLRGVEEFPSFTMMIIECHQDEVLEVPMGAEVIAFSEKTAVEGFVIEEHIMGIQGHLEYTKDILFEIIDRLANNNVLEEPDWIMRHDKRRWNAASAILKEQKIQRHSDPKKKMKRRRLSQALQLTSKPEVLTAHHMKHLKKFTVA